MWKYEVYEDGGRHRWRLMAPDSHVAAVAAHSFATRRDAEMAAAEVQAYAGSAPLPDTPKTLEEAIRRATLADQP